MHTDMGRRTRSLLGTGLVFSLFGVASGYAASLTICGVVDNGVADTNPAPGVISTSCTFSGGNFVGTVIERTADSTDYIVDVSGVFRGAGSLSLTGQFSVAGGPGTLYNYIRNGVLRSDGAGTSTATDFLSFAGVTVTPVVVPSPLPMGLTGGIGIDIAPLTFTTGQTFSIPISFSSGGADHYFDFGGAGGLTLAAFTAASTVPHPIPEPGTLAITLLAQVIVICRARRKRIGDAQADAAAR